MAHGHGPSLLSFYSKLKPGNGTALSDFLFNIVEVFDDIFIIQEVEYILFDKLST